MSLEKLGGTTEQRLNFVVEILEAILVELKIMNLHLQQGSDEEIDEGDVS